jgi:hypothetical protein
MPSSIYAAFHSRRAMPFIDGRFRRIVLKKSGEK